MPGSPSFEQWRSAGKLYRHRHQPVFVAEHGSPGRGSTLACIHGFPTASWDWHRLWPTLCERFGYVIAPDLLGHGWSAKPRHWKYSIFDQADMVLGLLADRGVLRCHLLVHDYGDTVAQELLARHIERHERGKLPAPRFLDDDDSVMLTEPPPVPIIESVCFLNGGLFPELHRARPIQKLLMSPLAPLLVLATSEAGFSRSLSAVFGPATRPNAAAMREFWRLMTHDDGQRIAYRMLDYIPERKLNRGRWVSALQQTRVPLRLVNGPEDPVSGAHMAQRYREQVANADVVLLPGIGHYPQIEAPEQVLRALIEFHERLQASDPTGDAAADGIEVQALAR